MDDMMKKGMKGLNDDWFERVNYENPQGRQMGSKLDEFLSFPRDSRESSKKNGDDPTCGSLLGG